STSCPTRRAPTSTSSSASSTSRSRSSAPAPSARASSAADSSGPGAAGHRERAVRLAQLTEELGARGGALLIVERYRPGAGRPGSADERRPEVLEVGVVGLDLEQLHLGAPAEQLRDLVVRAIRRVFALDAECVARPVDR